MKAFRISSPAYKANGLHGTYYSIALCEDNGDFYKIFGDHSSDRVSDKFFKPEYTNIFDVDGIPFSDADRFISIEEVKVDVARLSKWENNYKEYLRVSDEWYHKRREQFGECMYDFIFKKGKRIQENSDKYDAWTSENPMPDTVSYYDFLKAIIHEN